MSPYVKWKAKRELKRFKKRQADEKLRRHLLAERTFEHMIKEGVAFSPRADLISIQNGDERFVATVGREVATEIVRVW